MRFLHPCALEWMCLIDLMIFFLSMEAAKISIVFIISPRLVGGAPLSSTKPHPEPKIQQEGGQRLMCWVGVVEGTTIIAQFDPNKSFKGETYLEMLKNVFRPMDRSLATINS